MLLTVYFIILAFVMQNSEFNYWINMVGIVYRLVDIIIPSFSLFLCVYLSSPPMSIDLYYYMGLFSSVSMLFFNELRASNKSMVVVRTLARQLELTCESWVVIILLLVTFLYLAGESHLIARRAIVLWFLLCPFLILILNFTLNFFLMRSAEKVKLLCVGDEIKLTSHEAERIASSNVTVSYCGQLLRSANVDNADFIIFNYKDTPSMEEIKLLTHMELAGVKLISVNEFYERYLRKCHIPYMIKSIEFMNDIKKPRKLSMVLKHFIDYLMASMLLLVTIPILIYSALKIREQSPGPVLFKQTRVGGMMWPFYVMKFRSMHVNSDFNPYTEEEDDRIFPYGKFMRRARIDEIPQLWNILKGDMHFIGPRAEWDILVENYEKEIPYYHERHLVKPGITGWAQVMYPYGANTEDARQKLMYDLYYIKHWSLWLEIETIVRTIGIVLGRKGR